MRLRHEVTYQGYPASAVQYRRSPGLVPETGWVDLNMQDVKNLRMFPRDIPWRPIGGSEIPGQIDINTFFGLRGNAEVTEQPELPGPSGGGFNPFGDLVLSTFDDMSGSLVDRITYKDVYVGAGGVEEITQDLAGVETHSEGRVRVPLTDIRRWYRCGALYCRINRRLKSGNWDKTSLQDGAPWALADVLRYLASQLPGSPAIVNYSEALRGAYDPPTDIVGEGEPVVEFLQKVLDHYGLVACLLPSNNLVISGKYSTKYEYKEAPGPDGNSTRVPEGGAGLHYEKKSVSQTDRPPAVVVCGKRRIKRGTFPYIPVLQYLDGRYYPLQTVLDFMAYPKSNLDAGVFNAAARRFHDVGPSPESSSNGRLHEKHRSILAMAYKVYAPAFLFPESGETGSAMTDVQAEMEPYLPVKECPWYIRDFSGKTLTVPQDKRGKGDQDEYVLMPPIARAHRRGKMFFKDFKAIDAYFQSQIERQGHAVDGLRERLQEQKDKLGALAEELTSVDDFAQATFKSEEVAGKWKAHEASKFVEIDRDASNAAREAGFGEAFSKKLIQDKMSGTGILISIQVSALSRSINALTKMIGENDKAVGEWKEKFQAFKSVYEKRGGIQLFFNIPYEALENDTFKVDPETGILTSSEPLCMVDKPFFYDGDSVKVLTDGAVTVTYGYEMKDNSIQAYTAFLFAPSGGQDQGPSNAVFAGVCRGSPVKALGVPMNGRMYVLDLGTPVNFNACYSEAYGKAAPLLGLPAAATGYIYEVDGFRNYWLDAGISSVQHTWDGSARPAYTFLAVNAPGARLPAGPPMMADRKAFRAERAEDLERSRGD